MVVIAAVAVGAVLYPIFSGRGSRDTQPLDEGDVEAEVERYRAALRAGTVCFECGRANPEDARFCAECGRALLRERLSTGAR